MTRRINDITQQRLALLNSGLAETTVLTECLAIDFAHLMKCNFPDLSAQSQQALAKAAKTGITSRMALAAQLLHLDGRIKLTDLQHHNSDTVRGWACYFIAQQEHISLTRKLEQLCCLADDHHFGVREWVWLAIRKDIIAQPQHSLELLLPWTANQSYRVRRFACEVIRPRGVWCAHFILLKAEPHHALPILEALRCDPEIYVQDSVANWLNDASKSNPDWVIALCQNWLAENPTTATMRICKRALRTLTNIKNK